MYVENPGPLDVNADGVPYGKWLDQHCSYYERGYTPPHCGTWETIEWWNACMYAQEAAYVAMKQMDEDDPD